MCKTPHYTYTLDSALLNMHYPHLKQRGFVRSTHTLWIWKPTLWFKVAVFFIVITKKWSSPAWSLSAGPLERPYSYTAQYLEPCWSATAPSGFLLATVRLVVWKYVALLVNTLVIEVGISKGTPNPYSSKDGGNEPGVPLTLVKSRRVSKPLVRRPLQTRCIPRPPPFATTSCPYLFTFSPHFLFRYPSVVPFMFPIYAACDSLLVPCLPGMLVCDFHDILCL